MVQVAKAIQAVQVVKASQVVQVVQVAQAAQMAYVAQAAQAAKAAQVAQMAKATQVAQAVKVAQVAQMVQVVQADLVNYFQLFKILMKNIQNEASSVKVNRLNTLLNSHATMTLTISIRMTLKHCSSLYPIFLLIILWRH